jgi:hypothetical protein
LRQHELSSTAAAFATVRIPIAALAARSLSHDLAVLGNL